MIESKKALAEQVVGAGEQWLTEMDTNQLRNLLLLFCFSCEDALNDVEAPIPEPDTQDSTANTQYPLNIEQFWQYNEPLESSLVVIAPPSSDTVLDVLGPIPLPELDCSDSNTANSEVVMQYLDTVYKAVSQQAVLAAMNLEAS